MGEELFKHLMETDLENAAKIQEILKEGEISPEAQEAAMAALKLLQAFKDAIPSEIMMNLAAVAGYGHPEPQKEEAPAAPAEPEKKEAAAEVAKQDLDPETQAKLEALYKQNEEITKALEAEREGRILREHIDQAAKNFGGLGVPAEELGAVLKAIDQKLDKAEAEKIRGIFSQSASIVAKSALLESLGSEQGDDNGGASGAMDKLTRKAEEIRKEHPGLTHEGAFAQAMKDNPDLYSAYTAEKAGR